MSNKNIKTNDVDEYLNNLKQWYAENILDFDIKFIVPSVACNYVVSRLFEKITHNANKYDGDDQAGCVMFAKRFAVTEQTLFWYVARYMYIPKLYSTITSIYDDIKQPLQHNPIILNDTRKIPNVNGFAVTAIATYEFLSAMIDAISNNAKARILFNYWYSENRNYNFSEESLYQQGVQKLFDYFLCITELTKITEPIDENDFIKSTLDEYWLDDDALNKLSLSVIKAINCHVFEGE